jgi:hypothetical protein
VPLLGETSLPAYAHGDDPLMIIMAAFLFFAFVP